MFPRFIQRLSPEYTTFISKRTRRRPLENPTVKRDVCPKCNNELLSKLDGYGAFMCKKYFSRKIAKPKSAIEFSYDYNRLLKWLLKVSYNAARVNNEFVVEHQSLVPYVLGRQDRPPLVTNLFVGIIRPVNTNQEEKEAGLGDVLIGDGHRIGHPLKIPFMAEWIHLFRFIQIYSYLFHMIVWRGGAPRPRRREELARFIREWGFFKLNADKSIIQLTASKLDARHYHFEMAFSLLVAG